MSVLTDGSQARKTGSDKELVMVRTERAGKLNVTFFPMVFPLPEKAGPSAPLVPKTLLKNYYILSLKSFKEYLRGG